VVPAGASLLAWLAAGAALGYALRGIDWGKLADRESALVYAVAVGALSALHLAALSLRAGEDLHFAGAAIATLMFGWRYALLALAIATAVDAAASGAAWIGVPWAFLSGAVLPVAVTWWVLAATRRWLPRNPFAYFLGAAFGGGAASMLAIQLAKAALLLALGISDGDSLATHYLLTLPAMMFGEGFLTGGALTLLATWRPRWVATFDDDFYLRGGPGA
jgi:uncharacterized membrane protein